jgi:hypothetical protein
MRRMKSRKNRDVMKSSRRLSSPRGQSSENDRSSKPAEDEIEETQAKGVSKPEYGFIEKEPKRKEQGGKGRPGVETDSQSSQVEDEIERGTNEGEEVIDKKSEPKNEGRPDQLSGGSDEEDEVEPQEPAREESRDEAQEIESDEIDEADEEARGGIVKPDMEEDEELKKRRKGYKEEPRTNPEE